MGLFSGSNKDQELADEINCHIEMHTEANMRAGMDAVEARRRAIIELGGIEATKQAYREQRSLPAVEALVHDARFAVRQLRRYAGFTATVLLTLAIGVGGATSVFSCVYGLLLKGLPFADAGRIVTIGDTNTDLTGTIGASYPEYLDWSTQQRSFSQLAAFADRGTAVLNFNGDSHQVHEVLASEDFFTLLGTAAQLGRLLQARDNRPGSDRVAVLSATAWQRYLSGDPKAAGRTVDLNGDIFTIVGVLPSGSAFPAEGDVWLPLSLLDKETRLRGSTILLMFWFGFGLGSHCEKRRGKWTPLSGELLSPIPQRVVHLA